VQGTSVSAAAVDVWRELNAIFKRQGREEGALMEL